LRPPVDPAVFVREFLDGFLEAQFVHGVIPADEYYDLLDRLQRYKPLTSISNELFEKSPRAVHVEGFGDLRLIRLREPDGSEFPFLQGLAKPSSLGEDRLSCFVGHRFLPSIERALRFNLRHLFEPHGVRLCWSGYDLSAQDVFQQIVSGIRNADLCFFDNLGTLNKPNVYIEVGMAHVLAKPMLVCEYSGPGSRGRRKIPDTGSVPSDLQGLLRIQYRSYEDLCQKVYFGLPVFLQENGLRS
jgi:hypothetical protein